MRKNVLIVRLGRIGDAVLATPLPREIKRAWPDARVGVLVAAAAGPVFEHNPHVDVILHDDHGPGTASASFWVRVRDLRRRRFTHGIMLRTERRSAAMLAAAGISVRLGPGFTIHHVLTLTRPVPPRDAPADRHEGDAFLDLLRPLGITPQARTPEVHLTDAEQQMTALRRAQWDAGGRFLVGIHGTGGGSSPNWAGADWAQLATSLAADPRVRVVATDRDPPPELAAVPQVVPANRRAPLRSSLVNLAALDLLVSSSTGPMHLAAALGVPTLSLFCPLEACRPERRGPRGNKALFVLPEPGYCSGRCPGEPGACTFAGSREVSPELVAARVLHQLGLHEDEVRTVASLGPDDGEDSAQPSGSS